ncbi:hypothetical protein T552_01249 [Pneumocystis carinii B80]|uniref:Uncharacterized protein n=1 Tax=Pneumocystis carinii (strain B80) TaxID=1408658 RepID=A0A0W4ZLN1_PNEC8|nr:hypothetical protein T552_01249 [Pneumocystis carinii B80]KTW29294.1 hypothetical protein T552_01249 [Pneumocystis carinii B80]
MVTLVSSVCFISRGVAAEFPKKYVFNDDEYKKINKLIDLQVKTGKNELKKKKDQRYTTENMSEDEEMIKKYNLEDYDMEPYDNQRMNIFTDTKDLIYYENEEDDPYINLRNDDSDEERDELRILSSDDIILATKTEDDVSYLEVYVYEALEDNLYVHHDIMLPSIPLSLEWFGYKPNSESGGSGNFAAVGTLDPDIEIWDLDIIDPFYPVAILGNSKVKRDMKKKSKKVNSKYHVDSVLSLSINKVCKNMLASGSADTSIKIWDLDSCVCTNSYVHHLDKVSYIEWHPSEETLLLSGSHDHTSLLYDVRSSAKDALRWNVKSDIESTRWDLYDFHYFYISTSSGIVYLFDVRKPPSNSEYLNPVWTLKAHDGPVSAFDVNPFIKGYFVTGSTDKSIKLWNKHGKDGGPSIIVSKNIDVGKVFSVKFSQDKETMFSLVAAGSEGVVKVWNTLKSNAVKNIYECIVDLCNINKTTDKNIIGLGEEISEN